MSSAKQAVFARHETFHPRYGWLKKGFDNPEAFLKEDAHLELGVGKNMARAIKYWCQAFKVLEETTNESRRNSELVPTAFATQILGKQGFDPYLEDLGSLWLLHWQLFQSPCLATAWEYTFNEYVRPELTVDELVSDIQSHLKRDFPDMEIAESSLRKDASCLVRMYGRIPTGSSLNEESLHCPFAELGLLREESNGKTYTFRLGPKPGLSNDIIAFACYSYALQKSSSTMTVSLPKLLRAAGSPGLVFRLTENDLYIALEDVSQRIPILYLTEAAGIIQVVFSNESICSSDLFLNSHYTVSYNAEVHV